MLWRCLQSRIITNKHANFFAQDYFFLLLLEKSGLVTLLADVQMAKFDQNLTKIWSKLWSSPNFHLWHPNSHSPSKISFWDVFQRILVKVIVKYLQLCSNKNSNVECLLLSSGKEGQGQFFCAFVWLISPTFVKWLTHTTLHQALFQKSTILPYEIVRLHLHKTKLWGLQLIKCNQLMFPQ